MLGFHSRLFVSFGKNIHICSDISSSSLSFQMRRGQYWILFGFKDIFELSFFSGMSPLILLGLYMKMIIITDAVCLSLYFFEEGSGQFACTLQAVVWVASVLLSIGSVSSLQQMERRPSAWDESSVTQVGKVGDLGSPGYL